MCGNDHSEEAIFERALECQGPSQRERFLREACGRDDSMRRRLMDLLSAHERAGRFLEGEGGAHRAELALAVKAAVDSEAVGDQPGAPLTEKPGDRIGRYRLVEQLGEGGFGEVWLAEQEEPMRRQVALKIMKLGMDTRQVVARFEAERQALALMDHPNIARVFDGGAAENGRPYFVMELVRGIPITTYCDRNNLSPAERLPLFIQVCQAVQHAHQKGIIHRDLKPSNILVTEAEGRPVPKVIDFGVAKAVEMRLTDKTLTTLVHMVIGTPAYMSPEQAGRCPGGQADVDTRSDIYSLGVLLYELLTGTTPFDSRELVAAGVDEMRRIIREQDPPRPSTRLSTLAHPELALAASHRHVEPPKLIQQVRGDLDWIVMKCLEKDRNRRYPTANGVGADVQRHLNHEPIVARPPSLPYRFRKMVRRNWIAFTAVNAVAAAVAIGLGISLWLLDREKEAHRHAHEAEAQATAWLRDSYLAQARANRFSRRPGQRFDGLAALANAAAIQPGLDLQPEAIACLALPDLRVGEDWPLPLATTSKAFDRTLQLCAYADTNGTLIVCKLDDLREVRRLPGPSALTWIPEFSPDGRFLAVEYIQPDGARSVWVWSLESGRAVMKVPSGRFFAFRSDSREMAVSTQTNTVVIHALPGGELVQGFPEAGTPRLRYSPDDRSLATGSASRPDVRVYDRESLNLTRTLPVPEGVFALAWHPESHKLAAANVAGHVFLFDIRSGKELARLQGHQSRVSRLAFSHAGNLLASSGWDGDICLWDPDRAALLLKFPLAYIHHFSPDDRFLAVTQSESSLRLLEVVDGHECRLLRLRTETGQSAWGVAFHPGSRLLVSAEESGLGLWDAFTGKNLAYLDLGNTTAALFHPRTGDLLTISPRGLEWWPMTFSQTTAGHAGQQMRVGPPCRFGESSGLKRATLSTDGTLLVATRDEGGADLIDLTDPDHPRRLRVAHPGAACAAISPDTQRVATGTWQGWGVRIWDRHTGRQQIELPVAGSASVAFSPDGRWLVTGTGREYAFWAVDTWRLHHTVPQADGNRPPGTFAFGPDTSWAASTHGVRRLRLVEPLSGRGLATLEAPDPRTIWTITVSPDNRFLAVPTEGHLIQLWDLPLIRRQLAAMNLDWEAPPYPPAQETDSVPPLHIEVVTD